MTSLCSRPARRRTRPLDQWTFAVVSGDERGWTWDEFRALPSETVTVDIHCVTRWSKLDTMWQECRSTLLSEVEHDSPCVFAFSDEVRRTCHSRTSPTGKPGSPSSTTTSRSSEHGGPARLLVPHLYFWKARSGSAGSRFATKGQPGFWETYGYRTYGDPWLEQRFAGD